MILELNAWTLVEETRREDERLAMNADFTMRWRFTMIQRTASARGNMHRAKNDDEAGLPRPSTNGE
jgi:hypothetical protein